MFGQQPLWGPHGHLINDRDPTPGRGPRGDLSGGGPTWSPCYNALRVFGCPCYVHLAPHEQTKLSIHAAKSMILG